MRRLLIGSLLLLLALPGLAQEAVDMTANASIQVKSEGHRAKNLTDRQHKTIWQGARGGSEVIISSPSAIYGLYITWSQEPRAYTVEGKEGGQWVLLKQFESVPYAHQYIQLQGQTSLRLKPVRDDGKTFGISELHIFGEGELPDWVQRWRPTHQDADLLLLFAHADDEVLFFGGLLPYYGAERALKVIPVALAANQPLRRTELLNSLWSMGIQNYPVFGPFDDRYSWKLEEAYKHHNKRKTSEFITGVIRQYRPEVLVSHDINGEYGHGMHRLCADMALNGFEAAADAARSPESAALYGVFEVQKLYLHLYGENSADAKLTMDWDQPLNRFGGMTGFEVAKRAYGFHLSQHRYEQYQVEPRDSARSSYLFGLARSRVGPDKEKNDMFENLNRFQVQ